MENKPTYRHTKKFGGTTPSPPAQAPQPTNTPQAQSSPANQQGQQQATVEGPPKLLQNQQQATAQAPLPPTPSGKTPQAKPLPANQQGKQQATAQAPLPPIPQPTNTPLANQKPVTVSGNRSEAQRSAEAAKTASLEMESALKSHSTDIIAATAACIMSCSGAADKKPGAAAALPNEVPTLPSGHSDLFGCSQKDNQQKNKEKPGEQPSQPIESVTTSSENGISQESPENQRTENASTPSPSTTGNNQESKDEQRKDCNAITDEEAKAKCQEQAKQAQASAQGQSPQGQAAAPAKPAQAATSAQAQGPPPKPGGGGMKVPYKGRFYKLRQSANATPFIASKQDGILSLNDVIQWHIKNT